MNRRSFLGMIGLAPFAGAALASASVASIGTPQVISLALDSSDVNEMLAELEHAAAPRTRWTHIGNVVDWQIDSAGYGFDSVVGLDNCNEEPVPGESQGLPGVGAPKSQGGEP